MVTNSRRILPFNEQFFDNIDTEEKAYWLGFFTADGCIVSHKELQLLLCLSDVGHIRKFCSAMGSGHKVREYGRTASVRVCSIHMVAALRELGITERKSHKVQPCQAIPEYLTKHYWRGVFDGDGSIKEYHHKGRYTWHMVMAGNLHMTLAFASFAKAHVRSTARVRPDRRCAETYVFGITGTNLTRQLATLLYEEATVYLDRKYATYQRMKNGLPLQKNWAHITAEELTAIIEEHGGNYSLAATSMGMSVNTIFAVRKRLFPTGKYAVPRMSA